MIQSSDKISVKRVMVSFIFCSLLSSCTTSQRKVDLSTENILVGPMASINTSVNETKNDNSKFMRQGSNLSIAVTPFNPNIPVDSDEYEKKGIWPELRRTEANRFAVKIRDALSDTKTFEVVRVVPDNTVSSHLYINGTILESNGERVKLAISVISINQEFLIKEKKYSYEVKKYELDNPRNKSDYDLYDPFFSMIAEDISDLVKKLNVTTVSELKKIEELIFANAFNSAYFSRFLSRDDYGKISLESAPNSQDPMLGRIRALKVRDDLFVDSIQSDYDDFLNRTNNEYLAWQQSSYFESRAARKTKFKGLGKKILGVAALAGGALLATQADYYEPGQAIGGVALAAAGVGVLKSGISDSADSKMHKASLNEIGKSINFDLAPRVIEMEERNVELKGTAVEQYSLWQKFLTEIYALETTPDVNL